MAGIWWSKCCCRALQSGAGSTPELIAYLSSFGTLGFSWMDPQTAIDLGRDAIMISLLVSAPVLLAGMVVGLLVGLLQALTQIQEQTVAFVPKIVAMILVLCLALPWLMTQMIEYTRELILNIPDTF